MKTDKIRVAVAGGAGYTAGELLRLLVHHPYVNITQVISTSQPGERISSVHRDLIGETDLCFSSGENLENVDVVFLCLGHGLSAKFLQENKLPSEAAVIDLGNDFRLKENKVCGARSFIYGLPESFPNVEDYIQSLRQAGNVANPGCFATAIQLALMPLARAGLLGAPVHIHAITGATGAGRKLADSSHFAWRDNNISVYKVFSHQHLSEIRENLKGECGKEPELFFVPVRGNFSRGIFASLYTACTSDFEEIKKIYSDYYKNNDFVFMAEGDISLKDVVNTNKCLIHLKSFEGILYINSIIDNLLKGASGTAVQNMNLLFGLDPRTGLSLKPSAF